MGATKNPAKRGVWGQESKSEILGNDLLSRPVTREVPSALESLTAGFGMCPGVPSPPVSPRISLVGVSALLSKHPQN